MKFVVLLRYNVAIRNQFGKHALTWKIGRETDFESYCNSLFAPGRLAAHENLLLQLALPSLVGQSRLLDDRDFRLQIYTSTLLPEVHRNRLDEATEPYDWIEVIDVDPDGSPDFSGNIRRFLLDTKRAENSGWETFATIRLDDDDGLCRTYLDDLSDFVKPEYCGMCVSFAKGYMANYEPHAAKLCNFIECNYFKNAQGLAHINAFNYDTGELRHTPATVFDLGNHLMVDQLVPVICDARKHSYLRVFHTGSDSYKTKHNEAAYKDAKSIPLAQLRQDVDVSEDLV